MKIQFGQNSIGDDSPICIVFEAGATHYGLDSALLLVDAAAAAGADAIKFQMVDAKRLVPSLDTMFSYVRLVNAATGETESVTEPLQTILLRRELQKEEWEAVVARCRRHNLTFFSTATTVEELEFLHELGVDSIKIASGDINYHYFIRQAARYSWTIQIDTGNATIGEVEQAVDVLENAGCRKVIINHCPSGYPARLDGINLRAVTTLKQMFPYPIAFSDHTPGATMDIAAVALGVHMIEKTITLDKTIRSPEHIMSLEPREAAGFVGTIREVEQALGKPRRIMTPQEKTAPSVARRSVVAQKDIVQGECITQDMITYARPGTGLPANLDWLILGKTARRSLACGTQVLPIHVA